MRFLPCLFVVLTFTQETDGSNNVSSGTTGSIGTVTINGQIYNQFSIRPEIPIGKLGIGLDIYIYFNDNGMYWDSWDFSGIGSAYKTLLDKIYYLRWGQPGDELFILAGALPSITLGQGILINNYSNITEYPQVRQIGLNLQANISGVGIELIQSNFKSLTPGILGLRGSYSLLTKLNLGISFVTDLNQLSGLPDSDGDDYPDYYDFYPNDADKYDDSLYWRKIYYEIAKNYNEFDDWYKNSDHYNHYDPNNFESDEISGVAIDVVYSLTNKMSFYCQFAKLIGEFVDTTIHLENQNLGWGLVPFGTRTNFGPVKLLAEFRIGSRGFLFNYWDRVYDLNRVSIVNSQIVTRESQLYQYGKLKGFYARADLSMINLFNLSMGYQNMQGEKWDTKLAHYKSGESNQTFLATIGINSSLLPKIGKAEAFYEQSNVTNPFNFSPTTSTMWGYNVGIEISSGVMLMYQARTTYIPDLINQSEVVPVESLQIETQFIF